MITEGCPEAPEVKEVIEVRGACHTSSYEEEVAAMQKAIEWINGHATAAVSILIITDSQSLCIALSGQNDDLAEIQRLLDDCSNHLVIQWLPSHAGIEGKSWMTITRNKLPSCLTLPVQHLTTVPKPSLTVPSRRNTLHA